MPQSVLFEWEGREYEHDPKSADWYWALGIVSVAGIIASLLFASYLIALLILVAAGAIVLHSVKKPPVHTFRVTERGLVISEEFHPFDRMTSFSVLEDIEGELPPLLSIKTENWLSPHLTIPLDGVDADEVYLHFLRNVDESMHHPTFTDVVATWLGF
ncbi:MAG TPA: hypothetical protein VMV50_02265 [Candidatus Paceibacterota bacterium]|nr:hypothetical protein [Candidatus Paceibacterota bacterium]